MRVIQKEELKKILELHLKYLEGEGFSSPILSKTLNYKYWLDIDGNVAGAVFPNGSIRKKPLILRKRFSTNGYQILAIKKINKSLHRILAQEFLGSVVNKVVHHIDGNIKNNKVQNLVITSYSENNKHSHSKRNELAKITCKWMEEYAGKHGIILPMYSIVPSFPIRGIDVGIKG